MQTSAEIRRQRLLQLIEEHADTRSGKKGMANLCEKLGLARNEAAKLSRIANANVRKERGEEKLYNMGDATARDIEKKLSLPVGWMDTPIGMEALDDPSASKVLDLLNSMSPDERAQAVRLLDALKKPKPPPDAEPDDAPDTSPTPPLRPNGTTG